MTLPASSNKAIDRAFASAIDKKDAAGFKDVLSALEAACASAMKDAGRAARSEMPPAMQARANLLFTVISLSSSQH